MTITITDQHLEDAAARVDSVRVLFGIRSARVVYGMGGTYINIDMGDGRFYVFAPGESRFSPPIVGREVDDAGCDHGDVEIEDGPIDDLGAAILDAISEREANR